VTGITPNCAPTEADSDSEINLGNISFSCKNKLIGLAKTASPNTAHVLIIIPAVNSICGATINIAVTAKPKELSKSFSSPTKIAALATRHIKHALRTDGENPAKIAYKNKTNAVIAKDGIFLTFNVFSKKNNSEVKKPICNPDTAKI